MIRVLEDNTRETIPFCRIRLLASHYQTQTNTTGEVFLPVGVLNLGDTLVLEAIGYQTLRVPIAGQPPLTTGPVWEVLLTPVETQLSGVVIRPSANPADALIEKAIRARVRHLPENRLYLHYNTYSKLAILPSPKIATELAKNNRSPDVPIMLWEAVTERTLHNGGISHEQLVGSRLSGVSDLVLPFSPTDLQDLSIYRNYVQVLGQRYVSPLSDDALSVYRFELSDTSLYGTDTVWGIRFQPRKTGTFAFEGRLTLHNGTWGVPTFTAEARAPLDGQVQGLSIRQSQALEADTVWLPTEALTVFRLGLTPGQAPADCFGVRAQSWFVNTSLREPDDQKRHSPLPDISYQGQAQAGQRSEYWWDSCRVQPLTPAERQAYAQLDSLGRARKLGRWMQQLQKLATGRIGIGPLDLDITRLYSWNPVEHHRLGLGLWTNERLGQALALGAWFGYGTGDRRWKYGTTLVWSSVRARNPFTRVVVNAEQTLEPTGQSAQLNRPQVPYHQRYGVPLFTLRNFFAPQQDYIQRLEAFFSTRLTTGLQGQASLRYERISPGYAYAYEGLPEYRVHEYGLGLRWAPRETYVRMPTQLLKQPTHLPVAEVLWRQGSPDLTNLRSTFWTLQFSIQQSIRLGTHWLMRWQADASIRGGKLPLARLAIPLANGSPSIIAEPILFNTMPFGVYAYAQGASLWAEWAFQNTRFPSSGWSPDPVMQVNGLYGTIPLAEQARHTGWVPLAPTGYAEGGIVFRNIWPAALVRAVSTLQLFQLGLYYPLHRPQLAAPTFPADLAPRLVIQTVF